MKILLTNDDGVDAPGLAAMYEVLTSLGEVSVVAPTIEQSGASHSITLLQPLRLASVPHGPGAPRCWSVNGRPADCVRLGMYACLQGEHRPDLIVSGINGGLNGGINVLYSGTVAAAVEGAFYGITSIAVSLEYDPEPNFGAAAGIARGLLEQLLPKTTSPRLYNLNIPTAAIDGPRNLQIVPMSLERYGEQFLKRQDTKGRDYYWSTTHPPPNIDDPNTDLAALERGDITLTSLQFDLTQHEQLDTLKRWELSVD